MACSDTRCLGALHAQQSKPTQVRRQWEPGSHPASPSWAHGGLVAGHPAFRPVTLSMVILSPFSFLLHGCWENLGLLMSSFLFPNFVMVSGRTSQRCLLIWDHFTAVSSARALPRLCVCGPRAAGLPTRRRWSSARSVPLVLCACLGPCPSQGSLLEHGHSLCSICASEDDRKPQVQACHQCVSWPREGARPWLPGGACPAGVLQHGDKEAGVSCSCSVLGWEGRILTASAVSILASGPPVTSLIPV